jgi:hypothetical protein
VRLFSKNGFDVSELYPDVRLDLEQGCARERMGPGCILDGELIVVDRQSGAPLPWDNEKWRHNHHHNHSTTTTTTNTNTNTNTNNTTHASRLLCDWGGGGGGPSAALASSLLSVAAGGTAAAIRRTTSSTTTEEEEEGVLVMEYSEAEMGSGECWEDASAAMNEPLAVRFVPRGSAARWGSASARAQREARLIGDGRLRFVVFDALLLRNEDLSTQGYAQRFSRLKEALVHRGAAEGRAFQHVGVIEGTQRISTAASLVRLMREAVERGLEGYVLKDPTAPYMFERTNAIQKMKLGGPDVNTAVIGLGFSLSTNPRRWCLATGLRFGVTSAVAVSVSPAAAVSSSAAAASSSGGGGVWEAGLSTGVLADVHRAERQMTNAGLDDVLRVEAMRRNNGATAAVAAAAVVEARRQEVVEEEEEDGPPSCVEYYCATEVLEGDRPHRAFEIAHGLQSKVRLRVLRQLLQQQQRHATTTTLPPDMEERRRGLDEWCVLEQATHRVLVRPLLLGSVVEVKWQMVGVEGGRAPPVDYGGCVRFPRALFMSPTTDIEWLFSPWECPFSLSLRGELRPLEQHVLRHPVGRPEVVGLQAAAGAWDSRASVRRKFAEAGEVDACLERHTIARLRRLRALPPTRERLEEVGRIAVAWEACVRSVNGKADDLQVLSPLVVVVVAVVVVVVVGVGVVGVVGVGVVGVGVVVVVVVVLHKMMMSLIIVILLLLLLLLCAGAGGGVAPIAPRGVYDHGWAVGHAHSHCGHPLQPRASARP